MTEIAPRYRRSIAGWSLGLVLSLSMVQAQGSGTESLPTADQILGKYESFLGGESALSKVTTRTVRTRRIELSNSPTDTVLVRYSKKPMLSIMNHEALDGSFVRYMNGCDAEGGWVGYGKPGESSPPQAGKASTDGNCEHEAYYYGYLPLDLSRLKQNVRLEVKGVVQIVPVESGVAGGLAGGRGKDLIPEGPREVYLVLSAPLRSTDSYTWLYFDTKTGALLRRADAGKGPAIPQAGMNPRYTDFIQYREVGDGTRAPFQFVTTAPNSQVRGISFSIVDNTPVGDALLLRPKDVSREDKGF